MKNCPLRSGWLGHSSWQTFSAFILNAMIFSGPIVTCLLFVLAPLCRADPKAIQSRSFNGVIATFRIKTPVIRIGEDLKVLVAYRNTSSSAVKFRFSHVHEDMELFRKGDTKPIIGGFTGDAPYREVTLAPGENFRYEDSINMKGWPKLQPGEYQIQFGYHLGLFPDDSLINHYKAIYPHNGYLVPWSDRRHTFRLIR